MARRANYSAVRMRTKMRGQGTEDVRGAPSIIAPLLQARRAPPTPAAPGTPVTAKMKAAAFLRWRARQAMLRDLDADAEQEHLQGEA